MTAGNAADSSNRGSCWRSLVLKSHRLQKAASLKDVSCLFSSGMRFFFLRHEGFFPQLSRSARSAESPAEAGGLLRQQGRRGERLGPPPQPRQGGAEPGCRGGLAAVPLHRPGEGLPLPIRPYLRRPAGRAGGPRGRRLAAGRR